MGKHNVDSHLDELRDFGEWIFVKAFPDENEREDLEEQILPRIRREISAEPYSFCTLVKDGSKVIGGMVSDWYPSCNSLELIYIAIDESSRRAGLGKTLLNESYSGIRSLVEAEGGQIDHLLLEVDIPFDAQGDMNPVSRLKFWHKMGAKRIPFKYTQPPLSADKAEACNLMLLTIPSMSPGISADCIKLESLKAFLNAFYKGLRAEDSPVLKKMFSQLDMLEEDKAIALESLEEQPSATIDGCVVTYHFTFDSSGLELPDHCEQFNSFECDLMNYSNQELRPFQTYHIAFEKGVRMIMPEFYSYTSEGLTHYFLSHSSSRELKADLSISVSKPRKGRISVAHLSISPSKDCCFSDLDLIRLISAFGSRQEDYTASSELAFVIDGRAMNCTELMQHRVGASSYIHIHEGVSQFDISGINADQSREYNNSDFCKSDIFTRFGKDASSNLTNAVINKMLCGLILGIFDYHRMDVEEIIDTVRPIVEKNDSFMVLCRGHLLKLHNPDEDEKRMLSRILISPYILIPSTALAINDITLDKCEELMQTAFSKKYHLISSFAEEAEMRLNEDYLEDIFEYQSERDIIAKGRGERSMDRRYRSLLEKIEIYKNRKELSSNLIVELVLGVVAIFQILEVVSGRICLTPTFISILILFGAIEAYRWYKIRKG